MTQKTDNKFRDKVLKAKILGTKKTIQLFKQRTYERHMK